MTKQKNTSGKEPKDPRITRSGFSWKQFFILFVIIGGILMGQALILAEYLDIDLPPEAMLATSGYSVLMAIIVCLLIALGRHIAYEKPLRTLAASARAVAKGDFSVRAPNREHKKKDYADVLFEDFNAMIEELSGIETLKDDFVANVSHEIKTPLATIESYASELGKGELDESLRQEYTDAIRESSHRLSLLVSNILKLNRLENQVILPERKPYDLSEQLRNCVLQQEHAWESKNIEVTIDIDDEATIKSDESLLEIVWNNLLSNAIKFTEENGIVAIKQRADSAGFSVEISDTGCGIDEDTTKHVFEKFYQGDTSHSQEGNGLGLALTQKALNLLEGEILVSSEKGKGSTFTVWLPR